LVDYACRNWHYSGTIPAPIRCKIGVWEHDEFKGIILFGYGANPCIGRPFGLPQKQICELTRIALRDHETPVSRLIAIALRLLKRQNPDIRLVVSYADERHGHHGGIYQAAGWSYLGGDEQHAYRVNGRIIHPRSLHKQYGRGAQSIAWLRENLDPQAERINSGKKHKYVWLFDETLRTLIEYQKRPYPKCVRSSDSGTATDQAAGSGASPTRTLPVYRRKRIQYFE